MTSYEEQFDLHFMRIVNMCRGGITDDEIRVTAGFCRVPEWLVMRVGRDINVLTPEQVERYEKIIALLDERDANE